MVDSTRHISAIFHTSFHPTEGNKIDWSAKSKDFDLAGVEFSTLPSGLHSIDEDVIYFSHGPHQGVSVFLRQSSTSEGSRGARLSSLGILLEPSLPRPRPWVHVPPLKAALLAVHKNSQTSGPDWSPAQSFFDAATGSSKPFTDWATELSIAGLPPTLRLPYFLHLFGPSSLTLFKYLLARRRILIYTPPPVQPACELCHTAVDMVYSLQIRHSREAVKVLGLITLSDIDRIQKEDEARGWIACTTDALFTEKPQYYDLLIDLSRKRPSFKVTTKTGTFERVSFTWTDIKLWRELSPFLPAPPEPVAVTNMFDSWDNLRQFSSEFSLSVYSLFSPWPTTYSAIRLDGPEGQLELQPNGDQANEQLTSATIQIITTLTTNTLSQLTLISPLIPPPSTPPSPEISFSPKDVRRTGLNPFSKLDVLYFLGLARELAGGREVGVTTESVWEWVSVVVGSF